jgi:hypothetical protein
VTPKASVIGLAISAAACIGPLSEDIESHYADAATARRAGALDRGWLPEFIPDDATDISELHNLDTNLTWACFTNPRGPGSLRALLEKHGMKRATGPVTGGPPALFGTPAWWPAFMGRPDVETYQVVEDSRFSLLVGFDPHTGRACFHRGMHP